MKRLKRMTREEADDVLAAAKGVGTFYVPQNLIDLWYFYREEVPLTKFVAWMREVLARPELENPALLPGHLAILMEMMVGRFERFVEKGQFDSALPRLSALPMLYTPHAGKGSGGWKKARDLYETKKVGTDGLLEHRGNDPKAARNPDWGELAEAVVRACRIVSYQLPTQIMPRKARAVAYFDYEKNREGARKTVKARLYKLNDGGALLWNDWLQECEGAAVSREGQPCCLPQSCNPYAG